MTRHDPRPSHGPLLGHLALILLAAAATACAAGNADLDGRPACSDGEDNDLDGLIDLDDPGCEGPEDDDETDGALPRCSDGIDNDGDGLIDYPADPGCFSRLQDTEDDDCPDGPRCPECANGIDDDGDGRIDYPADPGCAAASGAREREQDPTACSGMTWQPMPDDGMVNGMLASGQSRTTSACGGSGTEQVYELYVGTPSVLVATTDLLGTAIDTVLYVRTRCMDAGTEIACNDDAEPGRRGSTLITPLEPGYYYLIVDGRDSGAVGNFQLRAQLLPGIGTACEPGGTPCAPGLVCRIQTGEAAYACHPPVCSDGVDNDGDGVIDHPVDPGCATPDGASEDDDCPDGPTCPQCANGIDDNGNGFIDYPDDPSCQSAGQAVEGCGDEQDPIGIITGPVTMGTTQGASNDSHPPAGCSFGAGGPEVVYFLTLPVPVGTLTVTTTGSNLDTVVYVSTGQCDGTYLGCNDDGGGNLTSRVQLSNLAAATYAIYVDGYGSTTQGPFTLNVNGVVAPGAACTHPWFDTGMLSCPTTHPCDGEICAFPACSNGVDDDLDGLVDYPDDPGCTSPNDTSEDDDCPEGPNCPACANGIDDDMDGLTDYPDDPNCSSASGASESCADSDPVMTVTAPQHTGSTSSLTNDFVPSCRPTSTARDQVWMLTLPAGVASLVVDTVGSAYDTVLMLKTAACGPEDLACDDDGGGNLTSLITYNTPAAGTYAIVVDGYSTASGNYTLNVRGTMSPGAACDHPLFGAGVLVCATGQSCNGSVCQ